MANKKSGNLFYVDTTGDLETPDNVKVAGIIVKATHATNDAIVEISNQTTGNPKLMDLSIPNAELTRYFDFSNNKLIFPNGLRVNTLTDAEITVIIG